MGWTEEPDGMLIELPDIAEVGDPVEKQPMEVNLSGLSIGTCFVSHPYRARVKDKDTPSWPTECSIL